MTTLCILLPLLLLTPGSLRADDTRQYQRRIIREVFDRLTAAAGEATRLRPRLVIDTIGEAAAYDAWRHTVHVDVHLYDLCKDMGADSINALATVIGHELAHYYLDHGGYDAHDRMDARKALQASLQWQVTRETEADFYGGIYRHLAGYDSYITPIVLEKLYEHYKYSDTSPEYLSRDKRKEIAITVDDSLEKLVPVFDMANNLTLARLYGVAGECYDYLIVRFPGREMFNNAGVVYAMQAVTLVGGESSRYTYPFELDDDTRLSDLKVERGERTGRTRSPSPSDSLRVVQLLDSAERRFSAAADKDSMYAPALINLASVRLLQGMPEAAVELARQAAERDTTPRTRLMALTMMAIADARMGRRDNARKRLKEIIGMKGSGDARALAQANLAAVDSASFAAPSSSGILSLETVEGSKASESATTAHRGARELIGGDSALLVIIRHLGYSAVLRVETRTQWIQFICTGREYRERSRLGISLGSTLAEVEASYHSPSRVVNAARGRFYIYESSKIIFLIGDDDKVVRWMIYDMDARQ